MAAWFGVGVALWGIPITLVGVVPGFTWGLAMLAVIGIANAVLDVTLFTMLGRIVPDEVLARVFGSFESLVAVSVGTGSVAAAVAVEAVGLRTAMIVLGSLAPVAVLLVHRRLAGLDERLATRQAALDVLQSVPMLATLPVPSIEHLAGALNRQRADPGEVVVREGEPGSVFYVVTGGEVEILDGVRVVRTMGPGEGFGEVSLLRDVGRTATVRAAACGAELYALTRHDFVIAVVGYSPAAAAAASTMEGWDLQDG